ncbi:MAG: lytic transglycosylase domain-containing protein [Deltaproteobacteria bacterium]|nr:lytic transglycosylase domain-containing protein [Deltaproteobacteria bacterium]
MFKKYGCLLFMGLLFLIPSTLSAQNHLYFFPSELSLCGERVPLENQAVWEMMDREFTLIVYDRAQVYLWLKRKERFFPFIETQLKAKGMPDDLKYLLVAESSLRSRAVSNKGASGYWQFMEKTGKRFNLRKNSHIDERLDLAKSTEAALSYLKMLYGLFGKWTLAMAAYNCGEERVKEEIQQQGENDYFRLDLPQETERYIFRILAAKTLLADPGAYGYQLPTGFGYPPEEYDLVTLQLPHSVHLRDLAKACGSYYKEMKELNEELQGYQLPAGLQQIKFPKGKSINCEKKIKDWVKSPKGSPTPVEGDKSPVELFF